MKIVENCLKTAKSVSNRLKAPFSISCLLFLNSNSRYQNTTCTHSIGDDESSDLSGRVYRSWKIVCNDGRWTGVSLGCDDSGRPLLEEEDPALSPFNASCPYLPNEANNVVAFYGDRELPTRCVLLFSPSTDVLILNVWYCPFKSCCFCVSRYEDESQPPERFEPGAELVFRCTDIGKYRLEGSVRRRCVGGTWDGTQPQVKI